MRRASSRKTRFGGQAAVRLILEIHLARDSKADVARSYGVGHTTNRSRALITSASR